MLLLGRLLRVVGHPAELLLQFCQIGGRYVGREAVRLDLLFGGRLLLLLLHFLRLRGIRLGQHLLHRDRLSGGGLNLRLQLDSCRLIVGRHDRLLLSRNLLRQHRLGLLRELRLNGNLLLDHGRLRLNLLLLLLQLMLGNDLRLRNRLLLDELRLRHQLLGNLVLLRNLLSHQLL